MDKGCFKIFMGLKDSSGWLSNSPKICTMGPNWILICTRNTLQIKRYFQYYWNGIVQLSLLGISHQIAKIKKLALNFWNLRLAPLCTTNVIMTAVVEFWGRESTGVGFYQKNKKKILIWLSQMFTWVVKKCLNLTFKVDFTSRKLYESFWCFFRWRVSV